MKQKFFVTVSDIALCQRCPALLGYKIHMGEKTAWSTGIKGTGEAYGSIFHKNISRVFFDAASDPKNILYGEIIHAVSGGFDAFNNFIRERIFLPFIESNSQKYTSGQITSLASGVNVWTRAMSKFFMEIPSLIFDPGKVFPDVFHSPELRMQAEYIFHDQNILVVTGCYDALLFNPDKAEARLFEFKGYNKSNLVVPLAQSLVYSWLIENMTGITPSIEIIYLDERSRDPDVFDSNSVNSMIKSNLNDLFASVFNVISLKKFPAVRTDKKLCSDCKFSQRCSYDIASGFKRRSRRRAMSLVNVMVFMLFSAMVMSTVFFYTVNAHESVNEERDIMRVRLLLEDMIRQAKEVIKTKPSLIPSKNTVKISYENFYSASMKNFADKKTLSSEFTIPETVAGVDIHNLYYQFDSTFDVSKYRKQPVYERIFAQMKDAYLIRAYAKVTKDRSLMIQAVIKDSKIIAWQEVWY